MTEQKMSDSEKCFIGAIATIGLWMILMMLFMVCDLAGYCGPDGKWAKESEKIESSG